MTPFLRYGTSHLVILALFAILVPGVIFWGKKQRQAQELSPGNPMLAWGVFFAYLASQTVENLPRHFEIQNSLPLHLCDFAWLLSAVALRYPGTFLTSVVYYWGITLTAQGLVSPYLNWDFPHYQFFIYWFEHSVPVLTGIYLIWGLGYYPNWSGYRRAAGLTVILMLVVYGINLRLGTNYFFVNAKPPVPSVLDYLGPWPAYLLTSSVLVLGVWALMTVCFTLEIATRWDRRRSW